MKRAKRLYEQVYQLENLQLAAWKAAKGKRHSREVVDFMADITNNLYKIQQEFITNELKIGNYTYFKIYEPKERLICAPSFHDQVVQHALMNICHDTFENFQFFHSYASRKGKGVHRAVLVAQEYTQKNTYYLKLDVKKFFDSIPHCVIKKQLQARFKEYEILNAFSQIIDSYAKEKGQGVPIGNLTSQYFANHFLAHLDKYIKNELKCKYYVRYMDDMILWDTDQTMLKMFSEKINLYVKDVLLCSLKPAQLNFCSKGVPFLGFRIFYKTIRLLHKSKIRFIRKMKIAKSDFLCHKLSEKEYKQKITTLLAFITHANSFLFRKTLHL